MKLLTQGPFLLMLLFGYTGAFAQPHKWPDTSQTITVKKQVRFEELMDRVRAQTNFDPIYPRIPDDTLYFETERISIGYLIRKVCGKFSLEVEFMPPFYMQFSRTRRDPGTIILEGSVVTESGEPLPGASVQNLTTKTVIVTRNDGLFSLSSVGKSTRFMVSCVGYSPKFFTPASSEHRTIVLTREYTVMNSINNKATARSIYNKKPGDWRSVKGTQLPRTYNVLQGMKGLMPGLQVSNSSGFPNSTPDIRFHGDVAISNEPGKSNLSKNDPLVLLNGIPLPAGVLPIGRNTSAAGDPTLVHEGNGINMLSQLNLEDIAEIIVLRDAAAIAAYGPRAANGAILINTRIANGAEDPQVTFKYAAGRHSTSKTPHMLTTEQYRWLRETYLANGGPLTDTFKAQELKLWNPDRNINWSEEVLGNTGQSQNLHVSVSGGDSIQKVTAGTGYYEQQSVLPVKFPLTRLTQYLTGIFTPDKRLTLNISFNAATSRDELPFNNPMSLIRLAPNAPYPFKGNQLVFEENNLPFINPYGAFKNTYIAHTSSAQLSSSLDYILSPVFNFQLTAGAHQTIINERNQYPIAAQPNLIDSSYFEKSTTAYNSAIIEPQLHFHKRDSLRHFRINNWTGITLQSKSVHWSEYQSTKFASDAAMRSDLTNQQGITNRGNGKQQITGLYNRSYMNFNNNHAFSLSGRLDESRINGIGKPLFSWSMGYDLYFAQKGKERPRMIRGGNLKFSIGKVAADGSQNYGYVNRKDSTGRPESPDRATNINRQVTLISQLGLQLNILDWLSVAGTYFHNRTSSGLSTTRYSENDSLFANRHAVIVRNSGLELELQAEILESSRKFWNARLFITIPRNKLLKFTDIQNSDFNQLLNEGEAISSILGYKVYSIDPANNQYVYVDVNKDGIMSYPEDATIVSFNQPKWFASLINNIKLNDFGLDLVLEARSQTLLNPVFTSFENTSPGRFPAGGLANHSQALMAPSVVKFFGNSPSARKLINDVKRSDLMYGQATYINLSALKISYRIPVHKMPKLILTSATVYCEVQNAFTCSKYKFADPLIASPNAMPSLRSIIFGVHFTP
ncbi:TonB-dependent receptor plug domain-containing protein [Pseudoflavitalea rhizosphaerae]|uniref:TonB-dependent receptor plug domain-containing protein n=1 Tax=Pseudoflavitalea rhizosphaerae TaxID=1884793 RepID=UPI000F8F68D5|nr:TonB-dependent receptor plug domain-containing protein [Pseudoflavitalea rhizosphaerae]